MGRKGKNGSAPKDAGWKKPVLGILLAGCALVSVLALSSYQPRGAPGNWAGPLRYGLAGSLLETAGTGRDCFAFFPLGPGFAPLPGPAPPSVPRARARA